MKVEPMSIEGAWVFTPRIHGDERGAFLEWFKDRAFTEAVGHRLDLAQRLQGCSPLDEHAGPGRAGDSGQDCGGCGDGKGAGACRDQNDHGSEEGVTKGFAEHEQANGPNDHHDQEHARYVEALEPIDEPLRGVGRGKVKHQY